MTRTALLLAAILLLGFPGAALADDSSDDLVNRLTKPESDYVTLTRAGYASIRAELAPLRSALADPTHVTVEEWRSLGSLAADAAGELSRSSPPPAFARIEGLHQEIYNAAGMVLEVSAGFDAALGTAAIGAAAAGGGDAELGLLAMAIQLANLNSATEKLEGALGAAEAGLEILVAARVEQLVEQEETVSGLSDLLGISLDPHDYCFIATAAYGTPAAREIQVLRDFRDGVLLQSTAGRDLVGFYYAASPPVADFIAEREWLRTAVREGLVDPIVWLVREARPLWDEPPSALAPRP
jgi:hypothetical protein